MLYDFAGYATKNNIKCSDGRTIRKDAFAHQDGTTVPLVWHHQHNSPDNILGHAMLENRPDGVYAYATFNETERGKIAKQLVKHGDICCLSIFANHLKEQSSNVMHGMIQEVSLVIGGANPGAKIENLAIEHGDGIFEDIDEAIITCGDALEPGGDTSQTQIKHEDAPPSDDGETVQDVINTMNEKQKNVMFALLAAAQEDAGLEQSDEGGDPMLTNIFEGSATTQQTPTLTHDDFTAIMEKAQECKSFKKAFLEHAAATYGIENIEYLFPDAKTVTPTPDFIKRDTEWVSEILNGVKHSPFSRIKSTAADITADEARAKGYVKGNLKKEEVIKLLKRTVGPTTIYKKQKLDRDDIIDITDFKVVSWLWQEMRMMLNEELARAILVGDGREADDQDKINEENIRPIWKEPDMYAERVQIPADATPDDMVETVIRNRKKYKGKGSPKLYAEDNWITDILLLKDKIGRRIYRTRQEIANEMNVSGITDIPVMENQTRVGEDGKTYKLLGIITNLQDYTVGTDRGGEIATFEDFDIDYNQYKYLLETRCSGTLTHPKSAIIIEQEVSDTTGIV